MLIKKILGHLYKVYIYRFGRTKTSENYIKWLKFNGISVGKGTYIHDPKRITIDVTRPELLEIGEHVFLHSGTLILTHDWASWCFVERYNDFIPSHGKVVIGNNVWLGENVTILKGVEIGDNVIIGAGSIVTKSIPSNSVAVGVPARVISTMDEYYNKRKTQYRNEAIEYCREFIKKGIEPPVEKFYDDYPIFVDRSNYKKYNYPYNNIFNEEQFNVWIGEHKAEFSSFDDFVEYCKTITN